MKRAALPLRVIGRKPRLRLVVCIGCGCDDLHACTDFGTPCHWVAVNHKRLVGICSACAEPMLQALLERHQ